MATARRETAMDVLDSELIGLARGGDREAAAQLLLSHELLVFRVCAHLLPAGEDVEAAVQETLLRALKGLRGWTGGSFRGWIAAIALNYCRDRLRRRRLIPFVPLDGDDEEDEAAAASLHLVTSEPGPERVTMAREAVDRLRRELRRLPERQREVFALRFFAELPLEGIGAALGVDVGTVKTHLHRAVRRLRAAVEEAVP